MIFCLIGIMSACGSSSAGDKTEKKDGTDKVADEASDSNDNGDGSGEEVDEEFATDEENADDDDQSTNESVKENKNENAANQSAEEEDSILSAYSSEEIEYARVWLQLGENQEINQLYAEQIAAGEPLHPDDETSVDYPEDVVQLSGTRLVDGTITYSSNGDGTVNVYDVPKRWDGVNPAGEDVYKKIIANTEQVSIDPGDDEEVKALIKKLEMN